MLTMTTIISLLTICPVVRSTPSHLLSTLQTLHLPPSHLSISILAIQWQHTTRKPWIRRHQKSRDCLSSLSSFLGLVRDKLPTCKSSWGRWLKARKQ